MPDLDDSPYLIISSDCHAGLPTEQYRTYIDSKYHPAFDDFLAEQAARIEAATKLGVRNPEFARHWFEEHEEGLRGGWDSAQRDKEMDADGVTAEVIFPDADAVESTTAAPFGVGLTFSGGLDQELALVGARAHNRWLAELCAQSPQRRRGVALVPITGDVDAAVAEIRRARESGLGAVMIPAMWEDKAPYHDRRYDPVWAVCEELQMPVATHSGVAPRDEYGDHLGIYVSEVTWWPARPIWFLIWSGVFERFPGLKFGVTEAGCWWAPNLLWFMDRLFLGAHAAAKLTPFEEVKRPPSEYFDRNCFIGASNTKRRELAHRYEIGVDNMLWGNDFPHPEGTWPNTRKWLRTTFHDIPVEETRRMIGLAAAEVYGFDIDALRPVAERINVRPGDLGQTGDEAAGWAAAREVGRHWLTGHDFPAIGYGAALGGHRTEGVGPEVS
ncbi:MAG: amidohydrolase [Catenulispora sp.]|nr:amidohydrolase [Catenulispora sp.]